MKQYRIRSGAEILRRSVVNIDSAEKIVTTKDVVYDENDLMTVYHWPQSYRIRSYVFELPAPEAFPWDIIEVFPQYVEVIEGPEQS